MNDTIEVPLYGGRGIMLIDSDDYRKHLVGKRIWLSNTGYATTAINGGTPILVHRLIMNPSCVECVDHINGNRLDDRRCNLRLATHSKNKQNRRPLARTKSGFKGVTAGYKGKWSAHIKKNGKAINIGSFPTKEEAARAYDKVARELHGEFAYLNFKST